MYSLGHAGVKGLEKADKQVHASVGVEIEGGAHMGMPGRVGGGGDASL